MTWAQPSLIQIGADRRLDYQQVVQDSMANAFIMARQGQIGMTAAAPQAYQPKFPQQPPQPLTFQQRNAFQNIFGWFFGAVNTLETSGPNPGDNVNYRARTYARIQGKIHTMLHFVAHMDLPSA